MAEGSERRRGTPFKRLGSSVFRRRKYILVVWIIALVLAVPIASEVGKVTSLQQGAATGSQLESVKASDIISAQFQRSVPNSTLLVVITGKNVSSVATQEFVGSLVQSVKHDKSIVGLNQTLDVYSRLYVAINGINNASWSAYDGANGTSFLLFGVPAVYVGIWSQVYAFTHNVTTANAVAFQNASLALGVGCSQPPCPPGPNTPVSQILAGFNSAWTASWTNPATSNLDFESRAHLVAEQVDGAFVSSESAEARPFSTAVLKSFSIDDYLGQGKEGPNASRLAGFAESFTSNLTSFSRQFVDASYGLGRTYSNASLYSLTGSIIWRPSAYSLSPGLSTLVSSLVSPDHTLTLVNLGLNRSADSNIVEVRAIAQSIPSASLSSAGVQSIQLTGGDAISYDFGNSTQADLGLILPVTIALLIAATGIFFRSVLTPFITLGTIGVALGISQVFVVLVGTYIAKVDFTVPTILLTILIGVGTDYSVFVIARYREERVKGSSVQEAVETSVTWAGESIATSGATVIISFLALSVTSIVFLRTMGIVVGLGVLVALAVALTLVPAVVSMTGGRTFWPLSGKRFASYSQSVLSKLEKKRGYFSRSGAFSVHHAKTLIVLAIVVSIPAIYVYSATTPTYDFISAAPSNLESVSASNHLTTAFGGGRLFPSYVVLTFSRPLVSGSTFDPTEMRTVESVSGYLATSQDVRNVSGPTRPFGTTVDYLALNYTNTADKSTFASILQSIGKDNRTVLITVNFQIDPYSTRAISDAQAVRNYLHSNFDSHGGITGLYVGGASGGILDTKNVFDSQFNSVVPIVAVGVALVLLVVLGSLFLPVFAVLSVLMSIVWTLAATKLVFQAYFNYQILFITPFFLFVTLLGLGMDYNIFILTRIREEATKGRHLDDAIVGAIEQTGGIITAAAIILAGSLGALMLSSDLLLKQLGFAFAYSILIDALVVRTYLVPAVMKTMGRWNWFSPIPYLNRSHSLYVKDRDGSDET